MPKIFRPYGGPRRPHPGLYVPPGQEEPPPPDPEDPPPPTSLYWPPPAMSNPVILNVTAGVGQSQSYNSLSPTTDYIVRMPTDHSIKSLNFTGGRNIIIQGGHISVPWQGDGASISSRRAMSVRDVVGTFHMEGVLIDGPDISEGIQFYSPRAICQLENVRIDNVHARDQYAFSDNHPDIIQTDGNVTELRIDRFTGWTDYQGLFFSNNFGDLVQPVTTSFPRNHPDRTSMHHGSVHLRNVNIRGFDTHRYQLWFADDFGDAPSTLHNVWLRVRSDDTTNTNEDFYGWPHQRSLRKSTWPDEDRGVEAPDYGSDAIGSYVTFENCPHLNVTGKAYFAPNLEGIPPGGDFVPAASVGLGYVSPWGNR